MNSIDISNHVVLIKIAGMYLKLADKNKLYVYASNLHSGYFFSNTSSCLLFMIHKKDNKKCLFGVQMMS